MRAIYTEDQAQEEAERGCWKHGGRSRPAAEWRPLPYGLLPRLPPIPSALYEAIERLGMRDEGTGATFQALEKRGLIICRYHRWLATLSTATTGASMGNGTRIFLEKRGLIDQDEWGLVRISDAGRAYYDREWAVYREHYPQIDARPPTSIAEALASGVG